MGEMGVAHIQMVIIMQTGVDRDTELHKAIQIVPTHLDGDCQQLQFLFLHLQCRAEDPTEAVSRGWNRRPY